MTSDTTTQQVLRQLDAMHADLYEVGICAPKGSALAAASLKKMDLKCWDRDSIEKSIGYLKHQNATGFDIYARPNASDGAQHSLSMVDDLTPDALNTMLRTGYQPCVVYETSKGNFHAWLDHGKVLDHRSSTEAGRHLAQRFSGDKRSCDYRHFGRLAGFTNRKEERRDVITGLPPYVKLHLANHRVYDRAPEVIHEVDKVIAANLAREQRYMDYWKQHGHDRSRGDMKSIDDFRKDNRYGGDHNREDFAYGLYAAGKGLSKDEVRRQLAARDGLAEKKGSVHAAERYIDATIDKAYSIARSMGGRELGR